MTAKVQITLTVEQIRDLAEFAGFTLKKQSTLTDAELEVEITIEQRETTIFINGESPNEKYDLIAYCTDYPEEGCVGLGKPLAQEPQPR